MEFKEWTPGLVNQLEKANNRARELDIGDWVPVPHTNTTMEVGLWDVINNGEHLGIIHPGLKVLDMGSGSGSSSIIWAYKGYNVVGIELHPELVSCSKESIRKSKNLIEEGINIKIFQGSYYPKNYIKKRNKGESIAQLIEKEIIEGPWNICTRKDIFHPTCKEDVYLKKRLDLESIDIFYSYAWPIQVPSVLEIFKLYARDDSTLCLIGHIPEECSLEKLSLKHIPNSHYIKKNVQETLKEETVVKRNNSNIRSLPQKG